MKVINIRENQNCFIARESFEDALRSLLEDVMGADDEYTRGLALRISREAASSLFPSDAVFGLIPARLALKWFDDKAGAYGLLDCDAFIDALENATEWNVMHAW